MVGKFNIRVYGVWVEGTKVLLAHEDIDGFQMTKFPGGGVELGEGIMDGLRREFREELSQDIHIIKHLYTTDFFVVSAFNHMEQIISVYYIVSGNKNLVPNETFIREDHTIQFQWREIEGLSEDEMTFPVDKIVVRDYLQNT